MKRVILAIIFSLPSTLFAQTFTYAPINVPGAVATQARGINKNGEVVGFYQTTTCTYTDVRVPTCPTKGFKLVNGTYVKLMVPNSVSTAIMGVNDYGDLTGFYKKSDGTEHGFIWYHTNIVRTIDFRPNGTVPWGINKAGMVVGGVWGTGQSGTFPSGGWVWINGNFSNMNPSNGAAPCCESVTGISNNGILSGLVFQADFFMAWMKESTDEDFFTYPNGGTQCCDTSGTGINSNIDMIGFTGSQGWFTKHIELNEVESSGEVTPQFIKVSFPGQSTTLPTYPFGLNDIGWIVGTYTDGTNHTHGFVAKPNF